jgi:hypothetical protein
MRNRSYLWLLVVALVCVTVWAGYGQGAKPNPVSQTWDYKWISVARAVQSGGAWSVWAEDDKPLQGPVTIASKIKELGDQGWELCSVTPISNNSCTDGCAGFTSQISYYFKRPK